MKYLKISLFTCTIALAFALTGVSAATNDFIPFVDIKLPVSAAKVSVATGTKYTNEHQGVRVYHSYLGDNRTDFARIQMMVKNANWLTIENTGLYLWLDSASTVTGSYTLTGKRYSANYFGDPVYIYGRWYLDSAASA